MTGPINRNGGVSPTSTPNIGGTTPPPKTPGGSGVRSDAGAPELIGGRANNAGGPPRSPLSAKLGGLSKLEIPASPNPWASSPLGNPSSSVGSGTALMSPWSGRSGVSTPMTSPGSPGGDRGAGGHLPDPFNNPTLSAAANLAHTLLPDPAQTAANADSQIQQHKMDNSIGKVTNDAKTQANDAVHDGTDQASSSVDQASNSVAAGIKLQFQMTELQNAKNMAEMVANAIKGLGNTAKSAGQGLAGQ